MKVNTKNLEKLPFWIIIPRILRIMGVVVAKNNYTFVKKCKPDNIDK